MANANVYGGGGFGKGGFGGPTGFDRKCLLNAANWPSDYKPAHNGFPESCTNLIFDIKSPNVYCHGKDVCLHAPNGVSQQVCNYYNKQNMTFLNSNNQPLCRDRETEGYA